MELHLIEQHYKQNYARLVKSMTFKAGNQWAAEDIIQSAYERAIRYREASSVKEFPNWLSLIIRNCFIDHMNAERGYSPLPEDYDEPIYEPFEGSRDIMREVFELIDTKSVYEKEILTLHLRYHYAAKDIAAITKYNHVNIRKTLASFRRELADLYKD
jgi:RNA polymerase sigma factor (sigma-70 family)